MSFREWLNEGWGLDPNFSKDSLIAAAKDVEGEQNRRKRGDLKRKAIDDLTQVPSFVFNAQDHPEDFIKIEPLNKAQSLPEFDKISSKLPDFEGVKIHYGFKFADMKNHPFYTQKKIQLKQNTHYQSGMNLPPAAQQYISKQCDSGCNSTQVASQLVAMGHRVTAADVNAFIDWQYDKDNNTAVGGDDADLKTTVRYMNLIQQGFLRALKHPTTPRAIEIRDKFVKLAIDNYKRIYPNKHYDYVVYPESSGSLNEYIAVHLAAAYNATPVRGFDKRPKNMTTIDTHNMSANFGDKESYHSRLGMLKADLHGDKKTKIKNVRDDKSRPYVRLFDKVTDLKQQGISFKKRSILLIDDNIFSSGTLQSLNHIIRKDHPRKIDIYTPLWVDFYH